MKKYFLIITSVLFFSATHAQSTGRTSPDKVQKSRSPIVADVPVEQRIVNADPRTLKHPMVISTEPAPKADPAREALAQRKQGKVNIEPVKN